VRCDERKRVVEDWLRAGAMGDWVLSRLPGISRKASRDELQRFVRKGFAGLQVEPHAAQRWAPLTPEKVERRLVC